MRFRLFVIFLMISHNSFVSVAQKLSAGPQVLTFHSDSDDTEQPYGLYIPQNYDASKKYPLVVMLHGAGSNHRLALRRIFGKSNVGDETDVEASRYFPKWDDVDYVVVTPYARGTAGYQGIPEQDVYDVLADARRRFNIDENRIYLTGLSMGGGGTLWIGLTRPDIWAAIAPVCPAPPPGTFGLAANSLNFPVHFFHGDADPTVPVEGTRKWVSHLQDIGVEVSYKEFVDVKHDSWVSAYDAGFIFEWFKPVVRNPFPDKVNFVSNRYKYNKAYWVTFDRLSQDKYAEIEAKFEGPNRLTISTKDLDGFTLRLKGHPKFIDGKSVELKLDGTALISAGDSLISFSRTAKGWSLKSRDVRNTGLQKEKGAEGPIFDAFSSRHIYVYGTADNPDETERKARIAIANQAANWSYYRGDFLGRVMFFPRVLADKDLRPSDLEESNLILFGTKETNSVIARHAAVLPIHLNSSAKDYGLFFIFPSNGRYLVISSGLPWWMGAKDLGHPFVPVNHRKLAELKDFILFKESPEQIVSDGYFNSNWKLPDHSREAMQQSGIITVAK
ncbi:hypothetical protein DYBT9275_00845 [Dyadobacter sp. CECT 9275]|uniref:Phospholipase/carboxylesterase/thioesterase domain-containing protein n=1 Tax=Dyadobacter helix TaxID=2822344 RepID=A0A916N2V9_9BACT|nr:alpha/beta hydrolase-fold protein [Dyadobacter sp. CECT 9275]CAG4991867.1 hypothetical protein DYBT9275_00845 [Dyadobacter sp. CECT 9275]